MENKRNCKKCQEEKNFSEFIKRKDCRLGIGHICLSCNRKGSNERYKKNNYINTIKNYRKKNEDTILKYQKNYKEKTKEKTKEYQKEYLKKWRLNNKEKMVEYHKNYYKQNKKVIIESHKKYNKEKRFKEPLFRLKESIRANINSGIKRKGFKKSLKTIEILGCSFENFKNHLESNFETWMSWNNYGLYNGQLNYGWDIDHIIPLYSAEKEVDVIKLNHYTNLQPLCSKVNRDLK